MPRLTSPPDRCDFADNAAMIRLTLQWIERRREAHRNSEAPLVELPVKARVEDSFVVVDLETGETYDGFTCIRTRVPEKWVLVEVEAGEVWSGSTVRGVGVWAAAEKAEDGL